MRHFRAIGLSLLQIGRANELHACAQKPHEAQVLLLASLLTARPPVLAFSARLHPILKIHVNLGPPVRHCHGGAALHKAVQCLLHHAF